MSSNENKIDVAYVAQLARLELSAEEMTRLQGQLGHVLEYVDQLRKLNVEGIEPMAHAIPQMNVFRQDENRPSMPLELALMNAPQRMNDLFVVPKVVED